MEDDLELRIKTIREQLVQIHGKFLTDKNVTLVLMLGTPKEKIILQELLVLEKIIDDCLTYENLHRAVLHLVFYEKLCSRYFSEERMMAVQKAMDDYMLK